MSIIQSLIQAAREIYKDNKILQDICIAQGVHESNLFHKPSLLASKYYNLFGIKKAGTAGMIYLNTKEEIKGREIIVKDGFGANKSILDSVRQHQRIMNLPRYLNVKKSKTFEEASKALVSGGYATDSRYATKLNAVYAELRFRKLL